MGNNVLWKTKDYAQLRAIKPWQGRGQQMELSGAGNAAHSKHTGQGGAGNPSSPSSSFSPCCGLDQFPPFFHIFPSTLAYFRLPFNSHMSQVIINYIVMATHTQMRKGGNWCNQIHPIFICWPNTCTMHCIVCSFIFSIEFCLKTGQ